MTFWIALTALTLLAVGLTVVPMLLTRQGSRQVSEQDARLAVLRDRRDEIDSEASAGRLDENQAAEAQEELIDSLAESLADPGQAALSRAGDTVPSAGSGKALTIVMAVVVVVALPVLSFLAYSIVGTPDIQTRMAAIERANDPTRMPTAQELDGMIAQIKAQLDKTPDDASGWYALGQAYRMRGDLPAAVNAMRRASENAPQNPSVLTDYAELLALSRDRQFAGEPEQLLRRAWQMAPDHPKANALLGASLYQAGKHREALPFLKGFLAQIDPQSDQARQIEAIIASIEQPAGNAPAPAASAAGNAPAAGQISGTITVSGDPPPDGAVLFISARLPSGPRMPFAAVRLPAGNFPVRFELSDANAMTAQRLLSSAAQVVVEARISTTGQAMRQPGDRFGVSTPVTPGDAQVQIVIDQTVQ